MGVRHRAVRQRAIGLASRASRGDVRAFQQLWEATQPVVHRYLRLLEPTAADKLAADTWVEVIAGIESFQGTDTDFKAWVLSVAHRRYYRWRTTGQMTTTWTLKYDSALDAQLAELATLPEEQAEAIYLRLVPRQATFAL